MVSCACRVAFKHNNGHYFKNVLKYLFVVLCETKSREDPDTSLAEVFSLSAKFMYCCTKAASLSDVPLSSGDATRLTRGHDR